jgi:pyrroloquinoline quinone biosynthesis protein D
VSERAIITEGSIPQIAPGGRVHFDKRRDQWVILAPERLFVLDAIAHEIIKRCDGQATMAEIVDGLAAQFSADRKVILQDVSSLLQGLADKRIVTL